MSDEHQEPVEPKFVQEETAREWLDLPADAPVHEPPPGDLPDNPPPARPEGVCARILRRIRGR